MSSKINNKPDIPAVSFYNDAVGKGKKDKIVSLSSGEHPKFAFDMKNLPGNKNTEHSSMA